MQGGACRTELPTLKSQQMGLSRSSAAVPILLARVALNLCVTVLYDVFEQGESNKLSHLRGG